MKAVPHGGAFVAIAALMLIAGTGIPVMAALNAGLARSVQSPVTASAILFLVALLICGPVALGIAGVPGRATLASVPPYLYLGALFIIFYLLSITWAAPRIGLGNAVFFVLLGQIVSATLIDQFGLFGAIRTEVDAKRMIGLALMAVGIYFARRTA